MSTPEPCRGCEYGACPRHPDGINLSELIEACQHEPENKRYWVPLSKLRALFATHGLCLYKVGVEDLEDVPLSKASNESLIAEGIVRGLHLVEEKKAQDLELMMEVVSGFPNWMCKAIDVEIERKMASEPSIQLASKMIGKKT